ncbi:TorD/DmsD family molecular chaperone [Azospirillum sp. B510]|uniref:TorD/DmsD family molecular chaperone n=1 Tax=Azospirillum sp. (strain B510) TaxID=137722 RepID=UPI0005A893C2|nr:molecular chaperone TorD family protein [Azospirillum sp. B510]
MDLPPSHQDGSFITDTPAPGSTEPDLAGTIQGVRLLAEFHSAEPTPALLERLRRTPAGRGPLALDRDDALQAAALVDEVVSDLPERITRRCLAPFVADFSAIHRTGALRACPTEGPWLEEKARADASASLLRWRSGLEAELDAPPLHLLPNDHIAVELMLLAALLDRGRNSDAVRFLDRHLLRWAPDFCSSVATRCREPFFAGIAILTNALIDNLRDQLGAACGLPRPVDDGCDCGSGGGSDARRRRRWTEGRFPRACACDP